MILRALIVIIGINAGLFGILSHAKAEQLSGRPAGCPHAWCGCWLGKHLGLANKSLWRAASWAGVGLNAGGPAPNVIAVWRHHVGLIRAVDRGHILLLSGNDGHAVRQRWRSTRGIIAYRWPV